MASDYLKWPYRHSTDASGVLWAPLRASALASLPLHTFKTHNIRSVLIDGLPWFVAADVCRALFSEFSRNKGVVRRNTLGTSGGRQVGNPQIVLVSESGLYLIVMRAQRSNPEAREFQDWVTASSSKRISPPLGFAKESPPSS